MSNSFKVIPFHLNTLVPLLFRRFKTSLEGIFWDIFKLPRRNHFNGLDVRKMGSLQNKFDLRKEKKSHGARSREYEGVPKLQCFFLRETDNYSGLCEQERYHDRALMRGLPKGSASCYALILRGAEESLFISNSYPKAKQ